MLNVGFIPMWFGNEVIKLRVVLDMASFSHSALYFGVESGNEATAAWESGNEATAE